MGVAVLRRVSPRERRHDGGAVCPCAPSGDIPVSGSVQLGWMEEQNRHSLWIRVCTLAAGIAAVRDCVSEVTGRSKLVDLILGHTKKTAKGIANRYERPPPWSA